MWCPPSFTILYAFLLYTSSASWIFFRPARTSATHSSQVVGPTSTKSSPSGSIPRALGESASFRGLATLFLLDDPCGISNLHSRFPPSSASARQYPHFQLTAASASSSVIPTQSRWYHSSHESHKHILLSDFLRQKQRCRDN